MTNSQPARVLARGGLIASGTMHILIGLLSIGVAHGLHERADQSGALSVVSDVPGGVIVLWIAAIALFGLAVWQWTGPVGARPQGVLPNKLRDRFKSCAYLFVGFAVVIFAAGGRSNSAKTTHTISTMLINAPGGVLVVAAVGVAVGVAGVVFVVRGLTRRFTEDIELPTGSMRLVVLAVGITGHCIKGLALILVALLFIGGAFLRTSSWSTGLDGAVRFLILLPTGIWPLLLISVGLIAQGAYLILRTRYMRR
ncbi:MAG: DUF1206 domain-containing protein [Lacisediminihabitans sp.]